MWVIGPFFCMATLSTIEFIPVEYRQEFAQNIKAVPIWLWLLLAVFIITGFVAGRDLVNWIYKE